MNSKWKRISLFTAIVALVSLSIAAILFFTTGIVALGERKTVTINEERYFDLEGIEAIDLSTISTDIRVGTSASGKIETRLSGTVTINYPEEAIPSLEVETRGRELKVWTERRQKMVLFFGYHSSDLMLELNLPAGYSGKLTIEAVSGDLAMEDRLVTELALRTTSGDFELKDIEAVKFNLKTTSGEVRARGLKTEEAEFSSVSGDIRIKGFEGDIALKNTSGETSLDYARFDNTVQISSISGDVRLGLPQTAEFRLNARSTSGNIDCDFPIAMTASSGNRRSIEGTVGSGTNAVTIKTVSGDIDIKS
jgi:lia operon protein LiaG